MNSKALMIVTTSFPYGQGESFVEAELAYVAERFDDVTLVPCFVSAQLPLRTTRHLVELSYTEARWGAGRVFHVIASFVAALFRHRWLGEAWSILGRAHRLQNMKELARSLYRARLFEQFLERQFANGKRYDMIYFYWITPEIAGALSFRKKSSLAAAKQLKIVARAHGGDLYEHLRPGGYAGLTAPIITGLDAIFCISEHGRKYLTQRYPAHAAHFHLARLGVEDPGFTSPQSQGNSLSILSCAFMNPGKRLHLIVEAIDVLLTKYPGLSVRWTHIGDGELFAQLQSQANRVLGSRGAQVVFKGYMKQAELVNYYRDAAFDLIVSVSEAEGIPVSLMEACSVGIPMVATDVGGSGEIVHAGNGALIAENASTEAIAEAFVIFLDKELAKKFRVRARADWHTLFYARSNYASFAQALLRSMEPS